MHACLDGTFLTNDEACFLTAVHAGGGAILAFQAFLAPASHVEIALGALGTMGSPFRGALVAENGSVGVGAFLIDLNAIGAQ